MKTITAEKYDSTTFKKWTDGPKVFLNRMHVWFPTEALLRVDVCHYGTIDEMKEFLHVYPSPVATVYALMSEQEFLEIVDIRPDLDVRLLVV